MSAGPGLLARLSGRAGRVALGLVFALFAGLALLYLLGTAATAERATGTIRAHDFAAFWAAARVAIEVDPVAALDPATLWRVQPYDVRVYLPFVHPPLWLALVTPLGYLPFGTSFAGFAIASALAFVLALRLVAPDARRGTATLLGAGVPVLWIAVGIGQTTPLWAAILVAALAAHERGRPVLAGALIGLLSIKPTLCLLLPLAFVAAREWRVVGAAAGSLALCVAVPTLWVGVGYWPAWVEAMGRHGAHLADDLGSIDVMLSWYAVLRGHGVGHATALAAQGAVTLAAAGAVWATWRAPTRTPLRLAVLCLATPIATPYAWHYELIVTVVGTLYLLRDGWGVSRASWALVAVLWGAGLTMVGLGGVVEFRDVAAPTATLLLVAALRRAGVVPGIAGAREAGE